MATHMDRQNGGRGRNQDREETMQGRSQGRWQDDERGGRTGGREQWSADAERDDGGRGFEASGYRDMGGFDQDRYGRGAYEQGSYGGSGRGRQGYGGQSYDDDRPRNLGQGDGRNYDTRYNDPDEHYGQRYDRPYGGRGSQGGYDITGRTGGGQSGYQAGYGQGGANQGSYGQGGWGQGAAPGDWRQGGMQGNQGQGGMQGRWGQGGMHGNYGQGGMQPGQGQRGMFRGKGPSGYSRSDERVREDVCDRLTDDDDVDATSIEVAVKNGEVILTGTVPDKRSKRRAEDCAEQVSGVKDVQNQLRVRAGDERGGEMGTTPTTGSGKKGERAQS